MMADDPKSTEEEQMEEEQTFPIDRGQVARSVKALWQYVQKSQGLNSAALLDFGEQVSLQLGFTKVPTLTSNKTVKIKLEHTLLQENQDVCLFVKDLDKKNRDYSDTVEHFEELLEDKDITYVTQIIPVKSLKTEYKPFESKRNLSDMYEFFLADDRIGALLPQQLGKNFLKKKRHPVSVNMKAKDLKKELDNAVKTSLCIITGRGASCQVKVAHTAMSEENAAENVIKAAETLAAKIPGGQENVKSIHIRTFNSPAIPVYLSTVNPNSVIIPVPKPKTAKSELGDVTTVTGGKLLVHPEGAVQFVRDGQTEPKQSKKRQRKQDGARSQQPTKKGKKDPKNAKKNTAAPKNTNRRNRGNKAGDSKDKDALGNPFGRNAKSKTAKKQLAKADNGNKKSSVKAKPPKIRKMQ